MVGDWKLLAWLWRIRKDTIRYGRVSREQGNGIVGYIPAKELSCELSYSNRRIL